MEERFWSKVDASGPCWLWTAGVNENGYGIYGRGGRGAGNALAHRYAWEELCGYIPDNLVLDHLCRVPACVNPDHLEPVSQAENLRRGYSPIGMASRKTHCPKGHPLDGFAKNGPSRPNGQRYCKQCKRDGTRRRRGATHLLGQPSIWERGDDSK